MATSQQHYSLRWNNYLRHITFAFDNLRNQDDLVDVTLCCDGKQIKAHKVLLAACSGYFKDIFKENPHPHPVIIFKFIKFDDLNAIIEFMYQGEVNVQQDALQSFLQTAELLAVQGLTSEEKPKIPKPLLVEQRLSDGQITKLIPSMLRTVTTENNTQTPIVDIVTKPNISKKRKIEFSDDEVDDQTYSETITFTKEDANIVKTTEMQYIPASVKVNIPEYINISDANQEIETEEQQEEQQTSQENATQTAAQFTSEYEILEESEIEEKFQGQENTENAEINTVEMGRIFTTSGQIETGQEKSSQDLPSSKWTECTYCKMVITTVNLWRHIRTQHTPQPPKKCEICAKQFKNKYSLREHIRISHEQKQTKIQNLI